MLPADAGFYRGSEKGPLTARNAPRSGSHRQFPTQRRKSAFFASVDTERRERVGRRDIGIGWNDVDITHQRASNLGLGGLIAGGILLSPIFAFFMALVVEILISLLEGRRRARSPNARRRWCHRRVRVAKAADVPAI
jgi:hypothetical protein